ncbi:MAG TPA: signal peptide peptidase SppA [Candidatus Acidoferrum sp.]|nr:signal peptide peptidase SppA [Candidatus Acidoferrum sp.]
MSLQFERQAKSTALKYGHILSAFSRAIWAILPEKFAVIQSFLQLKASGGTVSAEQLALVKRPARRPYLLDLTGPFLAGAIPHEKAEAKDDSPEWDGATAKDRLAKWASSDGSGDKDKIDWAQYRKGFAWYDSDNAESFGAYKFPHHDVKDDKLTVVWGGVKAAMGALLGSRGGTSIPAGDRKAVYDHLAAHYKEFDKEPPEYHSEEISPEIEVVAEGRLSKLAQRREGSSQAAAGDARTKDGSTIAVLPLTGTISHRMGMLSEASGGISTECFTQWLRAAAADPSVKAIVIDADSPGGTVDGVPELGDEIARVNKTKPVVGIANSMAASAAYWLLSQCGELVVTPSGMVGSVGVFASHEDLSKMYEQMGVKVNLISAGKFKTEGNPYEPLSDDAREALQGQVNDYYNLFTAAVARGRGTDQKTVKAGFGEGRMLLAQQAVKEGMADRVATLDQTLAKLGAKNSSSKVRAFAAALVADDEMDEQHSPLPDDDEDDPNNPDDTSECKCKCEACRATPANCAECSNEVCADENCAHEPRADAMPDVRGKNPAALDWKARLNARRRAMNLF